MDRDELFAADVIARAMGRLRAAGVVQAGEIADGLMVLLDALDAVGLLDDSEQVVNIWFRETLAR